MAVSINMFTIFYDLHLFIETFHILLNRGTIKTNVKDINDELAVFN